MIVGPFKNGTVVSPILVVIVALLLWGNVLVGNHQIAFEDFGLFSLFVDENISGNIWFSMLTLMVILVTAFFLNRTIDSDEFFERNTFLPALFYVLFMSIPAYVQGYSPIAFANFFIMVSFYWFLKIKRQEDAREIMFNSSFYLSVAILLFPVFLPLVLSPFILLIIFRPFVWREWVLCLLGFCLPVFFYFFGLYFYDMPFEENIYNESFWLTWGHTVFTSAELMIYSAFVTLLIFFSLYIINKKFTVSSIRLRKFFQFFLFNLVLFIMVSISLYSLSEIMFSIVALPLALVMSYYFYYAKQLWANIFFFLLMICSFYIIYFI
ncbi:MAG: hypothetical protein ACLGGV_07670 [Bacteroidia bacterium]